MRDWFWARVAFAIASLVAVTSAIVFGTGIGLDRAVAASLPEYTADLPGKIAPEKNTEDELVITPWPPPLPLPRADAWTYELFGPPELCYDVRSQQFTAVSPDRDPGGEDEPTRIGLELVAVHRRPFRLQLVGFFGEGSDASGTFANLKTGETFLARAGREVPELGLTITKFSVVPQPVAIPDSMTILESVATAEVLDTSSGEVLVLSDREWLYGEDLHAELSFGIATSPTREVTVGDEIQRDANRYQILSIRLNPPEVVIARLAADGSLADERTLVPAPTQSAAIRDPVLPP